jgi:hypothetical protein
VRQE